jgi:hypothetical protein
MRGDQVTIIVLAIVVAALCVTIYHMAGATV